MKRKGSEVWVGIFVVIGILILAGMTLKIEKFRIGKEKGYLVYVNFDSPRGWIERPVRWLVFMWVMWKESPWNGEGRSCAPPSKGSHSL
jgi:hypothetical protein